MRRSLGTAFIAFLLLASTSGLLLDGRGSGDVTFELPDLMIRSLEADPVIDGGFRLSLTVENTGKESSDTCSAILWDEHDLITGERDQIAQMTVPPLDPGDVFTIESNWDPGSPLPHRVWALVDRISELEERTKENNAASMIVQLPRVTGISSTMDRDPSHDVIGTFLKGIPLEIPVQTNFDMRTQPQLLKVYYQNEKGVQTFVPHQGDGRYHTSLEVGSMETGLNNMTVNTTYSRIPLEQYPFSILVKEQPAWISGLSRRDAYFDSNDDCYRISGYLDIPELQSSLATEGVKGDTSITMFSEKDDLLLTIQIKLDGTSTIDIEGVLDMRIGGDEHRVSLGGRYFSTDPWSDQNFLISGKDLLTGVEVYDDHGSFSSYVPDGRAIEIMITPAISGEVSYELALNIEGDGREVVPTAGVQLDMTGTTPSLSTNRAPGFDNLLVQSSTYVDWSTGHFLNGNGDWSDQGLIRIDTSISANDTGITLIEGPVQWKLPENGHGTGITLTPEGFPASIQITNGQGHNTAISLNVNGTKAQASVDNRYKSSPLIAFLEDGSPIAAWTKATTWSNDSIERMSSLRIKASIGSPEGIFTGNGSFVDDQGIMEFHPDLASDGKGSTALVWTRDEDSDPRTLTDQEIVLSILNGTMWTSAEEITRNSLWDDLPRVVYDTSSNLWVTWMSEGNRAMLRSLDHSSGQWGLPVNLAPKTSGSLISSIDISCNGIDDPILAYVSHDPTSVEPWKVSAVVIGPDRAEPLGTTLTISSFEGAVSDLSINTGIAGKYSLAWRVNGDGDGDIWTTVLSVSNGNLSRIEPLPLTNDTLAQFSPSVLSLQDGGMVVSYVESETIANSTVGVREVLDTFDLSSAAVITDLRYELLGEYNRWETISLSVDIKNVGLSPTGKIYVNLDRISRDPISGNVSELSIVSKLISFTDLGETETVEFTTTLVEHQLRYIVWTASGWGDPPAFHSSVSLSMPVISDPLLDSFELSQATGSARDRIASIRVVNSGLVSADPIEIRLLGEIGSLPKLLEGSLEEPVGSRTISDAVLLNITWDNLGPGISRTYFMNLTLDPGRNVIWTEIVLPDGTSTVNGPYITDLLPSFSLINNGSERLIEAGSGLTCDLEMVNSGFILIDGIKGLENASITYQILSPDGSLTFDSNMTVHIPLNSSSLNISFQIPTESLVPGRYSVISWLKGPDGPFNGIFDSSPRSFGLSIVDKANISIVEWRPVDLGFSGKVFRVSVENHSNRTIGITRVALFNGLYTDGVILSEGFITGLGPGQTGEVDLPFRLEEGLYYISIGSYTYEPDHFGVPIEYSVMDISAGEYSEEAAVPDTADEEEVDTDEVMDSALIGGSAIVTVLLISALFRRKDDEDEDEPEKK